MNKWKISNIIEEDVDYESKSDVAMEQNLKSEDL